MSSPVNAQLTGTFTSTGSAYQLSVPSGYNEIELINTTDWGSTAANTNVMKAKGYSSLPDGYGEYYPKTSGAATIGIPNMVTTEGFTFLADSASTANGASVALNGSFITQANPAVADSATTTGLVDGYTVVRILSSTGMLQIAGMDFTVGTVVASTSFQLKYLDSSGFAAAASAGSYRIINADARYYPRNRYITAITQASSAVITLSVTHGFTAGQSVRLVVPSAFGMTEMDGTLAQITAVDTTNNTITVNVDSTGYTAFAFPTSATAGAGVTFAQVVPVGETADSTYANVLADATYNQAIQGVIVGTSMQTTGKVYQWIARKGTSI